MGRQMLQNLIRSSIFEFDHVPEDYVPICSVCWGSDSGSPLCFLIFLQGLFGEWLHEARDTQACASSTSSQLTLEMLENDAYQSIIGEIYSTEYRSYAPNGDLNCSTAQVALVSQQSKFEESRVQWNELPANVSDSTFQVTRYSGFGPRYCDGIHISSCGHAVHQECHDRYLTSLKQSTITMAEDCVQEMVQHQQRCV